MNIILKIRHVDPSSIPANCALVTVPMAGGDGYYAAPMDEIARAMREIAADETRTLELVVSGEN